MAKAEAIEVYLETGKKKTFAVALDWPGWARSGRDEDAALQSLFDYRTRYAQVLNPTKIAFKEPEDLRVLTVVERQKGNTTTDFGAPNLELPHDTEAVSPEELTRWEAILQACWQAFDKAAETAQGKTLSKGPRGGGRALQKIVEHVRDVDAAYLRSLNGQISYDDKGDPMQALALIRQAILETLSGRINGDIAAEGPRGGKKWTPRYFVRRLAWHELDHAWEIEDRAEP